MKQIFVLVIILMMSTPTLMAAQKIKADVSEEVKKEETAKTEAPEKTEAVEETKEPQKEAVETKAVEKIIVITVGENPIYKNEVTDGFLYAVQRRKTVNRETYKKIMADVENYLIDLKLIEIEANKKDIKITKEEFDKEYEQFILKFSNMTREKFLESLKEKGLTEEQFKETFEKGLKRNKHLQDLIEPQAVVTDEEAKAFYDKNSHLMIQPEKVEVSHILLKSTEEDEKKKEELEKLHKRILKGEKFGKLAKNFSDCPSGRNDGNLGYILRGQTVKEFEDMAYSMEVGQVSDVFKTSYGYHILKVTDKQAESITPFEEAKEGIVEHLKSPKRKELYTNYMKEIRDKAEIKVYEDLLPSYEEIVPAALQVEEKDDASIPKVSEETEKGEKQDEAKKEEQKPEK